LIDFHGFLERKLRKFKGSPKGFSGGFSRGYSGRYFGGALRVPLRAPLGAIPQTLSRGLHLARMGGCMTDFGAEKFIFGN